MEMQEKIGEWKKQFGGVYKAMFGDNTYIFRGLTREDFLSISQKQITEKDFDSELETVKICVLDPQVDQNYLKGKPGIVTILSEQIMIRSGFTQFDIEEL